MSGPFSNVYGDARRADAYATLEFPGTYWLAFRDLPGLLGPAANGARALDFGCGAGRSTRFLKELGFRATGVDISEPMLERARDRDPDGDYRRVPDGDLWSLEPDAYDVVLSAFTFDNVPGLDRKTAILRGLRRAMRPGGRMVNLVSAPDIYLHEWLSFSTKAFPENRVARSGDVVRIVMLDVDDARPVEDVLCMEADYLEAYAAAGLDVVDTMRPLGRASEPFAWVTETRVSPWLIHVLARGGSDASP